MAVLKYFLLIIAVLSVLICSANDAIQHAYPFLIADCILAGTLLGLFFTIPSRIVLKIALGLCIISGVVYLSTSLKSLLLFIPFIVTIAIFISQCFKSSDHPHIKKIPLYLILSLTFCCGARSFWIHQLYSQVHPTKAAIVEHGKWGNAINHNQKLTITSQYSYNLLHDLIGATKITDLSEIDNFTELWMVTPTKPFNADQKKTISDWVRKGGRLIIITDHTDLFGHATALNPLLNNFGITVQTDVVLDNTGEGGSYYSVSEKFRGLSANSFKGMGETWLFQPGYSERTDYSKRSFFSDNQISDEELAGCFSIGIRTNYGLGGVIVFGDSTLFANFALARPSAQYILTKLIQGGGHFSCFGFSFFSCLIFLISQLRQHSSIKIAYSSLIGALFITCIYCTQDDKTLILNKVPSIKVHGDWSLVEGKQSHLLTLFSSAYASSAVFPIWEKDSKSDRTVTIGASVVKETDFSEPVINKDSTLLELVTSSAESDIEYQLSECIKTSGYSSFWFDEGIGFLRENAYKLFWDTIAGTDIKIVNFSIKNPITIDMQVKAQDTPPFNTVIPIMRIRDDEQWVILGNWLIGKYISDDTILVRKIWQQSSINIPDFYCRALENPAH